MILSVPQGAQTKFGLQPFQNRLPAETPTGLWP
jgi:hypothetical protein